MVFGGASRMTSPWCSQIRRPVSVTSPMSEAMTSHLRQISMNSSIFSGSTTAHMRSWDSAERISAPVMPLARWWTLSSTTCMPTSPAAANPETGQACATEVLNTDDDAGVVQVQAALDEDLLREGVADLHGRELALRALLEVLGGQDGHAADAVQAGAGTEEDDAVAGTGGEGQLQILGREHTHAEGVDQWVTAVGSVEDRLAADVRQAEGVTVPADARDHARQDALGIRGVCRAEAQLIHHCDRARTHGHDVADDAAHTGGRALVGLDVRRRVVALDLEGHGPAVADVDHAGVLADAGEHLGVHLLGGGLTEVTQVNLGGLIRAVLRPHHGVHGQLRLG